MHVTPGSAGVRRSILLHIRWCGRVIALLALAVLAAGTMPEAKAQLASVTDEGTGSEHDPKGALWRAAVVPGWGQIYNRQYIKLPFLYAAIGGLAYLASDLNHDYLRYRRAFLYKSYQELVDAGQLAENPNEDLKPYYDELASRFGAIPSGPIRGERDKLRRNRDLSFVGIGLVYGLSILDAYISAHLLDFDVSDDLTVYVRPAPEGVRASLAMRF